tara:strand:+ start:329 stop:640 length:312 start_codon:yes stop_codon:yes gene_type:complete
MGFWKSLGRKTHKAGNKFLKSTDKVAKFTKSVSHVASDVGGGVAAFGAATGQPELVAGGAALAGAGAMGTAAVKGYRGIRKGDVKQAVSGATEAHGHHAQHFR